MNKKECLKLIDKLEEKVWCQCHPNGGKDACLMEKKEIYIGHILKKIDKLNEVIDGNNPTNAFNLLALWRPCDFTKSLNEIMEESGFKTKNARKLFEFLNSILLT